jgi:glutamate synthase (NADPH/NADH) small chain
MAFAGFPGLERDQKGYIRTHGDAGRTSLPGVWAGGDIITGSATVISAMGCARKSGKDMAIWMESGTSSWI